MGRVRFEEDRPGDESRRDFLREALGVAALAAASNDLLKPLELLAAKAEKHPRQEAPKQGVRAHGVDYWVGEIKTGKLTVDAHMLSFDPRSGRATLTVHYDRNSETPHQVAVEEGALAAVNGTFFDRHDPLGSVAVDGRILYEAPSDVRAMCRTVLYIKKDGTVGLADFLAEHRLIDLADPNADLSRLKLMDEQIGAINDYRGKKGFRHVQDLWRIGLPREVVSKIIGEFSIGPKTERATKEAEEILKEYPDVVYLLGGLCWLIRDGQKVKTDWAKPGKEVKSYLYTYQHFTEGGRVFKHARRMAVATLEGRVYLIAVDTPVTVDELADALLHYKFDNAAILDGGESAGMAVQGDDGLHRSVDAGRWHRKTPTHLVIVGGGAK